MKKFLNVFLLGALAIMAVLLVLFIKLMYDLSFNFTADASLAHMQVPIFVMVVGMALALIVAVALAFRLVWKSNSKNIFEQSTVRQLTWIGHSFLVAFLFTTAILIYSYIQLGSEVGLVGIYILAAMFFNFISSLVLYFLANLFGKAVEFKEENDWTV